MTPRDWEGWTTGRRKAPIGPARRGARFGVSWWGKAWVEALEQRARLDPNRLPRGRTYARSGAVGELEVSPGEVRALVQGSRARPYSVRLRVREFTPDEWARASAAIAARAAHAAALLDGTLEPGIVPELTGQGVSLLPAAGELGPSCSCPDWADPCKHAAAVCYLVADLMDRDPFTIFLLRGRDRDQVLAGVRARRSHQLQDGERDIAGPLDAADLGIEARVAFQGSGGEILLPAPLPPPDRPGRPAGVAVAAGEWVTGEALAWLAADAAGRAFDLSRGLGDGGLNLSQHEDLARIAAGHIGRSDFDSFAGRSGMAPRPLRRLALAWKAGGQGAVRSLDQRPWRPRSAVMEEGLGAVGRLPGHSSRRGDRITNQEAGVQLRYGPDGLWYLLVRRGGVWEIHDPPAADPRALVRAAAALAAAEDERPLEFAAASSDELDEDLDDDWDPDEW
ncbi:MAG: SWIM zinc finger family protein [Candidatus Dormibacteria bacterium]